MTNKNNDNQIELEHHHPSAVGKNKGFQSVANQLGGVKSKYESISFNQDKMDILAQKTELLDKLRTLTGGKVVAVTLDRVTGHNNDDAHDNDDGKEVTNKQILLQKMKDIGDIDDHHSDTSKVLNSKEQSRSQAPFKYYQSDVKRLKSKHKRQDRQLKDNAYEKSLRFL